ncbi:branched-chain amino acid ABC transporter substrate-binding protein [Oceanithermus sp.]
MQRPGRRWGAPRRLASLLAGMLVAAFLLAACGTTPADGGGGCPQPATFDHASCTFDDAGTLFGP